VSGSTNKSGYEFLVAVLLLALSLGCGASGDSQLGPSQTTEGPPDAPSTEVIAAQQPGNHVTIVFYAEDEVLNKYDCSMLHWEVTGGYQAQINHEDVDPAGSMLVCLEETTTYELCVDIGEEWECREATIVIDTVEDPGAEPEVTEPTATSPPLPIVGLQQATLEVVNSSGAILCDVFKSPDGGTTIHGLFEGQLHPGEGIAFQLETPGDYVIWVKDCHNNIFHEESFLLPRSGHSINVQPLVLDLKITDLYPESQPIGDLWLRLTHMGHARNVHTWADIVCDLYPTVQIGPNTWTNGVPIHQSVRVDSPANPGETLSYNTGIYLNMNATTYNTTCQIVGVGPGFIDPNPGNNSYEETLP
jgi:hypothetical protein